MLPSLLAQGRIAQVAVTGLAAPFVVGMTDKEDLGGLYSVQTEDSLEHVRSDQ